MSNTQYMPDSWEQYIGQAHAVRQLKLKVNSAKVGGEVMGHVLIKGPAGVGKSSLAALVAKDLGKEMFTISGAVKPADARMLLSQMEDGDVLFYDEVHQAVTGGESKAEWLLQFLEDGMLVGPLGPEPGPAVTVIAASTHTGKLPEAVLTRFSTKIDLEPYSLDEAAEIAQGFAFKILVKAGFPMLSFESALAIAEAASSRTRLMRDIVCDMRDLARADEIKYTDEGDYDVSVALELAGITPDGLTRDAAKYLRTMYKTAGGNAVGELALSRRIGIVGNEFKAAEEILSDKGFVVATKTGRQLTGAGMRRAKAL